MILPYTIDFKDPTDPTKPSFQIQPGQIDTTTTELSLPGKGRVDYGELYNENLVHLLEHFSSPLAPSKPTRGQLWYNSVNKALMLYDPSFAGTGWLQIMTTAAVDRFHIPVVSVLPDQNLVTGDIVYLSGVEKIYVCVTLAAGNTYNKPAGSKQWIPLATEDWATTQLIIRCDSVAFA